MRRRRQHAAYAAGGRPAGDEDGREAELVGAGDGSSACSVRLALSVLCLLVVRVDELKCSRAKQRRLELWPLGLFA